MSGGDGGARGRADAGRNGREARAKTTAQGGASAPRTAGTPRAGRSTAVDVPVTLDGEEPGSRGKRGNLSAGDPEVVPAEPLSPVAPVSPEIARGSGKHVVVQVRVLIDESGAVENAQAQTVVVDSVAGQEGQAGDLDQELRQACRQAALDAARKTHFRPATKNGVPGKMWGVLNYRF